MTEDHQYPVHENTTFGHQAPGVDKGLQYKGMS